MEILIELFRSNFYWIDFAIGTLTPITVYFLYRKGIVGRYIWVLFWVGFALGLSWEVPMQLLNEVVEGHAVHSYTRAPPVHFSVIILMHSSWDGGLFLVGVWLCHMICGAPVFGRYKTTELIVLLLWGQGSALWVELTSVFGEAWVYIPRPWNPSLFKFMGHDITLMPQLIWLVAPVVFYFIAIALRRKY